MAEWEKSLETVLMSVFHKAVHDQQFRKKCLDDPMRSLREMCGKDVPSELKIRFLEEGDFHMAIVLPPLQCSSDELSEEEIECIIGGGYGCRRFDCCGPGGIRICIILEEIRVYSLDSFVGGKQNAVNNGYSVFSVFRRSGRYLERCIFHLLFLVTMRLKILHSSFGYVD